jgi:acetyl esterase/lipase
MDASSLYLLSEPAPETPTPRSPVTMIRIGIVTILFLLSLLVIVPAPVSFAWILAIVATELGLWLAISTLFVTFAPWGSYGTPRIVAMLLGSIASLLFLSPIAGAWWVQRDLENRLYTAFGTSSMYAPTREIRTTTIAYVPARDGAAARQLDVYHSSATVRAPCVLVIHGGSWARGDRHDLPELNRYLAERGYVVASMSYRLAPAHPFPAARDDVDSALVFLKRNAVAFGIDPHRFVLLGRSAGGELALLAAYRHADPSVRGVVGLYAPTDLRFGYRNPANPYVLDSRAVLRNYLGGTPATVGAQYDSASPISYLHRTMPPTLLIHGGRDELVTVQHSVRLHAALRELGEPSVFLRLPWATHGCDYVFSGPCGRVVRHTIERFIGAVTRGESPQG